MTAITATWINANPAEARKIAEAVEAARQDHWQRADRAKFRQELFDGLAAIDPVSAAIYRKYGVGAALDYAEASEAEPDFASEIAAADPSPVFARVEASARRSVEAA